MSEKPQTTPEWLRIVKSLQALQNELAANRDTDGAALLIHARTWIEKAALKMCGDPQ